MEKTNGKRATLRGANEHQSLVGPRDASKVTNRKTKAKHQGKEQDEGGATELPQSSNPAVQFNHRRQPETDEQEELQEIKWHFREDVSEPAKNTIRRLAFPSPNDRYAVCHGQRVEKVVATIKRIPGDPRGSFYCAILDDDQYHLMPASILVCYAPQEMALFLENVLFGHAASKK